MGPLFAGSILFDKTLGRGRMPVLRARLRVGLFDSIPVNICVCVWGGGALVTVYQRTSTAGTNRPVLKYE